MIRRWRQRLFTEENQLKEDSGKRSKFISNTLAIRQFNISLKINRANTLRAQVKFGSKYCYRSTGSCYNPQPRCQQMKLKFCKTGNIFEITFSFPSFHHRRRLRRWIRRRRTGCSKPGFSSPEKNLELVGDYLRNRRKDFSEFRKRRGGSVSFRSPEQSCDCSTCLQIRRTGSWGCRESDPRWPGPCWQTRLKDRGCSVRGSGQMPSYTRHEVTYTQWALPSWNLNWAIVSQQWNLRKIVNRRV